MITGHIHQQISSRASSNAHAASGQALGSSHFTDKLASVEGSDNVDDTIQNHVPQQSVKQSVNSIFASDKGSSDSVFFEHHNELVGAPAYQNPQMQTNSSGTSVADAATLENKKSVASNTLSASNLELAQALKRRDRKEAHQHEVIHAAADAHLSATSFYGNKVSAHNQNHTASGDGNMDASIERISEETLEKARVISSASNAVQNASAKDQRLTLEDFKMTSDIRGDMAFFDDEQDDVGKVVLDAEVSPDESQSEAVQNDMNTALPTAEKEEESKEKQEREDKSDKDREKERFELPMFNKDRKSAADLFREIYGEQDNDMAQHLVGLDINLKKASPLTLALDLTA